MNNGEEGFTDNFHIENMCSSCQRTNNENEQTNSKYWKVVKAYDMQNQVLERQKKLIVKIQKKNKTNIKDLAQLKNDIFKEKEKNRQSQEMIIRLKKENEDLKMILGDNAIKIEHNFKKKGHKEFLGTENYLAQL